MKFLADMGISLRTVEQLRQQGYDAMHLAEQRLERLADADILAKARTEGRVLLTVDLDFAQLSAMSSGEVSFFTFIGLFPDLGEMRSGYGKDSDDNGTFGLFTVFDH
jgi:hypothetical protein